MTNLDRRDFLRASTAAAVGLAGLLVPDYLNANVRNIVLSGNDGNLNVRNDQVIANGEISFNNDFSLEASPGLEIIDHPSPKRRTRANRLSTDFILLHTTEAPGSNSLNSLTRFGQANYVVDTNGDVYRIMNPKQISIGAGRSMWNGRTNLDNHAINIEFVGYHNERPTKKQLGNGRELIAELVKANPRINGEDIMPHSMVAYGRPNRWHDDSHRGRKRCGMLFAKEDIRKALGIGKAPKYDPDVDEGRLVVADRYLDEVLYEGRQPVPTSDKTSSKYLSATTSLPSSTSGSYFGALPIPRAFLISSLAKSIPQRFLPL